MIAAVLIPLATVVEVAELAETALSALVAGVGITFTFSTGIYGLARYADLQRDGRGGAALAAALLAVIGLLASAVAVVIGILVMIYG